MKLQERKEYLEKRYASKSELHAKRFSSGVQNEGAYQESVLELKNIYSELYDICMELNMPIPVMMW